MCFFGSVKLRMCCLWRHEWLSKWVESLRVEKRLTNFAMYEGPKVTYYYFATISAMAMGEIDGKI